MASIVNNILSVLTMLGQALVVVGIVVLFFPKPRKKMFSFLEEYGLMIVGIVALVATVGSLTYSEVLHYEPCKLCWIQRIFMYPQVILIGVAMAKKDKRVMDYILPLSILGMLFALYHYLLQIGMAPIVPCSVVGYSVSCAEKFVLRFGYITIPMMAFTAFAMNTFIAVVLKRKK